MYMDIKLMLFNSAIFYQSSTCKIHINILDRAYASPMLIKYPPHTPTPASC